MTVTVETQMENLRKFATPQNQTRTRVGCLSVIALGIIGLLAASFYLGGWVLIPFVLFLVILGLGINHSIRKIAPHLRDACKALDCHEVVQGSVRIMVIHGSDSDDYQAGVRDRQGHDWIFDFNPAGWIPKTGDFPAELRFVDAVEWPAFVVTEAGILYPKYLPTREKLDYPVADEEAIARPFPY